MQEKKFYIEHLGEYAWDYILWWKPDRQGYTYDVRKAGLYTFEEATSICAVRGQERAWAEEDVLTGVEHAVSIEKLHVLGHRPACEPTKEQRRRAGKNKKPNFVHCPSKSCKAWRELADGRGKLLTAYRVGGIPSEATLQKIDRATIVLEKADAERKLQEGK